MSQQNVEVIGRAFEAWQRGEPWAEILDPQIEWDFSAFPGLDVRVSGRGRANFLQVLDEYVRAWIDYKATAKELLDAGDDVVMVLHERVRARGTEMFVERDVLQVWTMQEGRPIRVRAYPTKREALEAVGLRE